MEEYYIQLTKHRYSKGIPTILIMDNTTSEVERITVNTPIQLAFARTSKHTLNAIAKYLLSNRTDHRVTCFHINYDDGTELVILPSFYN